MTASAVPAAYSEAWSYWSSASTQNSMTVNHEDWQTLLSRHVKANADGVNRVTYSAFGEESKMLLKQYLSMLSSVKPTDLSRAEQLAYWINLYNAQTVQVVLDHPRKKSIRSMGPLFAFGPWDEDYLVIEGLPVTLNDIEHRILRPIWQDHRLHFVLNCASIGCPNLSKRAYTADNIEQQLNQAEQIFLQHPRAIAFNDAGTLRLTSLFDWYLTDFAADETALLAYLANQRPDLSEQLSVYAKSGRAIIDYAYDWSLNEENVKVR